MSTPFAIEKTAGYPLFLALREKIGYLETLAESP